MTFDWQTFWTVALIFGGGAFAFVTVVVIYKGMGDLIDLIRTLNLRH